MSRPQQVDEQALDWFVRRGSGGAGAGAGAETALSPDEEAAFQAWLRHDARHARAYQAWDARWQSLDALPADGIRRLRSAEPRWRLSSRWLPGLSLAATSLVAALAVGLGWTSSEPAQPEASALFTQSFSTPPGQQREFTLPDGSRVRLGSGSRLEVALYRERRAAHLRQGQALFSVSADAARPFQVAAGPLQVTVVGTRFKVSQEADASVHVMVEEGRVRVRPAGAAASPADGLALELGPGQQVAADAAGRLGVVSSVAAARSRPAALAASGALVRRLHFENTPLATALQEFEPRPGLRVVALDGAGELAVTGTFDASSVEHFVELLPQVLPVQLRQRAGLMEIVPAP